MMQRGHQAATRPGGFAAPTVGRPNTGGFISIPRGPGTAAGAGVQGFGTCGGPPPGKAIPAPPGNATAAQPSHNGGSLLRGGKAPVYGDSARVAPGVSVRQAPLAVPAAHAPRIVATASTTAPATSLASSEVFLLKPQVFCAARALLAAQGPRRRRRKKKKAVIAIPGARLEHLMCCYENSRIQGDLNLSEDTAGQQREDLRDVNRARSNEVAQLSLETARLRRQLAQSADDEPDLLCEGGGGCDRLYDGSAGRSANAEEEDLRRQIESETREGHLRVEALQYELARQRDEAEEARKQVLEAQKWAAVQSAKLAVLRETHEQEVRELRRRLPSSSSLEQDASPAAVLEKARCTEADLQLMLTAERCGAREASALQHTKADLHKQETELLQEAIRAARASTHASSQAQAVMDGTEAASNPQTEHEVRRLLEDKVNKVTGEKLVADRSLRAREASSLTLRRSCAEMHQPAVLLFSALRRPALAPLVLAEDGSEDTSVGAQVEWLGTFKKRISDLCDEYAARE